MGRRLLLTSALLVALSGALSAQQSDPRKLTAAGRVVDAASGAPVAGATVRIDALRREIYTDTAGRFAFGGLEAGSYTFDVERLGYTDASFAAEVRPGEALTLRLAPEPVLLKAIEVLDNSFGSRTRASGYGVFAEDRQRLLASPYEDVSQLVRYHSGVPLAPCSVNRFAVCGFARGAERPFSIYLDDMRLPPDAGVLEDFSPRELYRVEVFRGLGQIRLYTPWYVEGLARHGRTLPPVCIVC